MNGRLRAIFVAALAATTYAAAALAQTPPPSATGSAAGAASAAPPARAATGYGYDDKAARPAAPAKATRRRATNGPVATLPGFEMLADGGSRLFVQLTKSVIVEEKKGTSAPSAKAKKGAKKGAPSGATHPTITYVIKGAQVLRRNNENALVTVHFNTPVVRARLVPHGRDLHFVVDLRADSPATWKLVPAKEDSTILQIDFPKGSFLPAGAAAAPVPAPEGAGTTNDDEGSK